MEWVRTVERVSRAYLDAGGTRWEDADQDLRRETFITIEDAIMANRELFVAIAVACFEHTLDQDDAKHQARISKILEPIIGTVR